MAPCTSPSSSWLDPMVPDTRQRRIVEHKPSASLKVSYLISVEELRTFMAEINPVMVADIRSDLDRSEWWILAP